MGGRNCLGARSDGDSSGLGLSSQSGVLRVEADELPIDRAQIVREVCEVDDELILRGDGGAQQVDLIGLQVWICLLYTSDAADE